MSHTPPCPDGHADTDRPVHALDIPALLVVGAMRAWVAPLVKPGHEHPNWREILRLAGVPGEGAQGFNRLMEVVAGHARRLIEVRCCHCPALGEDEVHMLSLMGALQQGDAFMPVRILTDWLPAGQVTPALASAQRFAAILAAQGLRLPGPVRPALLH